MRIHSYCFIVKYNLKTYLKLINFIVKYNLRAYLKLTMKFQSKFIFVIIYIPLIVSFINKIVFTSVLKFEVNFQFNNYINKTFKNSLFVHI